MILIVTNREDITADFVVLELKRRKEVFYRFNTEDFPEKVNINIIPNETKFDGFFYFKTSRTKICFSSIKSIWYRRPVLPVIKGVTDRFKGYSIREAIATLRGVWENLDCFWVNKPININQAENKLTQLKLASQIGFLTPQTIVSNDVNEIIEFKNQCKNGMIIKPVKSGQIDYKSVVFTNKVNESDLEKLKRSIPVPSIYQENIEKSFDIRITVIGKKIFAAEIHSQNSEKSKIDWRSSEDIDILHKKHYLPAHIERKCLKLMDALGLVFGAIDLILATNGKYYFLEINPNGQWGWIEKRTGHKLTEALTNLLINRGE